jgi:hypothetical protein
MIGEKLAVVIDGKLISAPVVRDSFSSGASVTGDFTREWAESVVKRVRTNPKQKTAQGVLKHFPSDVRSAQAWHGHTFMVGKTPVIATEKVPEEALMKLVETEVIVSGVWYPGERWNPTEEEARMPTPLSSDTEGVVRNQGIRASSVKPVKER